MRIRALACLVGAIKKSCSSLAIASSSTITAMQLNFETKLGLYILYLAKLMTKRIKHYFFTSPLQGVDGDPGDKGCKGIKGEMGDDAVGTATASISMVTIWGLQTCPMNFNEVYTGRAGTSYHNNAGAGANIVCMNDVYTSDETLERRTTTFASIFGIEYRTLSNDPLGEEIGENLPCAVCILLAGAVYMQPGTTQCPDEWSVVYSGFLMSELERDAGSDRNNENYRSEFICVHEDGENVADLSNPFPEAQIGHVHVDCDDTNILPCDPMATANYAQGQLSCVVCSKDL